MRVTILQHASGPHAALASMSAPRHQNYAEYHGLNYSLRQQARAPNHPIWNKVLDILDWCADAATGDMGIWVDADCLWVEPTYCLPYCFPTGYDLGAVAMTLGYWNTGVIFMRHSARLREFWDAVYVGNTPARHRFEPGHIFNGANWADQAYFNYELAEHFQDLRIYELNSRFNSFRWQREPPELPVVIRGWHSQPLRCVGREMTEAVRRLPFLTKPG